MTTNAFTSRPAKSFAMDLQRTNNPSIAAAPARIDAAQAEPCCGHGW